MDNSSGDVYKDTIDYIKKIEREIESSFESNNLRQLSDQSNSTQVKDKLVEKFNRDLVVKEPSEDVPPPLPQRKPKSPRKSPTVDASQHLQQSLPYHASIVKKNSNASNNSKTPSPQPPLSLSGESAGEENETVGELPTSSTSSRSIGSLNVDKESNYRYSFYDNSNQISIFLAHSSLIQKVVGLLISIPSLENNIQFLS